MSNNHQDADIRQFGEYIPVFIERNLITGNIIASSALLVSMNMYLSSILSP